jgi:hypothetical protein
MVIWRFATLLAPTLVMAVMNTELGLQPPCHPGQCPSEGQHNKCFLRLFTCLCKKHVAPFHCRLIIVARAEPRIEAVLAQLDNYIYSELAEKWPVAIMLTHLDCVDHNENDLMARLRKQTGIEEILLSR